MSEDMSIDYDPVPDELDSGIVIEAGAYEGAWTLKVCQQRPSCKVYAFEPASRAYKVAQEKLKDYPNVVLQNVALGKENGTAVLYDMQRDGANTGWTCVEPHETVQMVDAAEELGALGEIALAHLNAEGGELEIIERLIGTGLIERVKILLVQWHTYGDEPEISRRIQEVSTRLEETHRFERCVAWGCWKRIDNDRLAQSMANLCDVQANGSSTENDLQLEGLPQVPQPALSRCG